MDDSVPITVCIVTLNEEKNIRRCLNSVLWAEELLVVDSGSEDETRNIAEKMGARVIVNDWEGMKEQKQFATNKASHDWILNLDADEELDDELAGAIKTLFNEGSPSSNTVFEVNRMSQYLNQWIRHGSWYPDRIIRLFNRTETCWAGTNPHAHINPTENTKQLSGHLLHYPYKNLSDHLTFINSYTSTMAKEKHAAGKRGSIFKAITHGGFKLFKDLILKRGFMDGKVGLVIAVLGSYYVFLKYVKLWELQKQKKIESP